MSALEKFLRDGPGSDARSPQGRPRQCPVETIHRFLDGNGHVPFFWRRLSTLFLCALNGIARAIPYRLRRIRVAVRQLSGETTEPTVCRAIGERETLGIVEELTGRRRSRVYAYRKYLASLNQGKTPTRSDGLSRSMAGSVSGRRPGVPLRMMRPMDPRSRHAGRRR